MLTKSQHSLPNRHFRRREKVFGDGRPVPLDRNVKHRIMAFARTFMPPTEKGKHWGKLTPKFIEVLWALLFVFPNAKTGMCFPSYETIAAAAKCNVDTVGEAIKALEAVGILTWVHRLRLIDAPILDKFEKWASRYRCVRTSNGYRFFDPIGRRAKPSEPELPAETRVISKKKELDPNSPLEKAIAIGKKAAQRSEE
jgi:Helix-turn-helix domain